MKKLLTIIAVVFAFSTTAFADADLKLPDEAGNTAKVCYWFGRIAGAGAQMREAGRKNVVEFFTKEQADANSQAGKEEYDTMGVMDIGYSPEEKKLIELALTEGWLVADSFKKQVGEDVGLPPFGKFAAIVNEACQAIQWTAPISEQKLP